MDRETVGSRLEEAGLPSQVLLALSDGNPSSRLPYHNNDHCYNVAVDAFDLGKEYIGSGKVSLRMLQHILVAGLFHDYDHTGYSHPDKLNIDNAVMFIRSQTAIFSSLKLNTDRLIRLVKSTQNPARLHPEYNFEEQIMRDADLLGWCHEQNHEKFLHGLSIEFEAPVTVESTKQFFRNTYFYTEAAKRKMTDAGWLEHEGNIKCQ